MNLTTPDLVVLSLLSERPMHGYELVQELYRREVEDWAGVSRPQVYYSLKKVAAAKLIRPVSDDNQAAGPERQVYEIVAQAREALADALAKENWATQRPPQPFITWVALSRHATRKTIASQLQRRRDFLLAQIAKERETLKAIRAEGGALAEMALAVVGLGIRQFEVELQWLDEAEQALLKRRKPSPPSPRR